MELDATKLRALFRYDQHTGHFFRKAETHPSGRLATRGYRQIAIGSRRYMAHRLAWLYVYGEWPSGQLDHINQVKDDNRIDNLRLADNQTQQENVARYSHNTTGFRGVTRHRCGKFQAQIGVNGKTLHLGLFATLEQAASARMKAEQEHFRMLENSPIYSRITHGEELRVEQRAYSLEAPGTITVRSV